jgi:hypothetical protein
MRLITATLALALLSLAFAPAPFPKRQARLTNSLEVSQLVGTWSITGARGGLSQIVITPTQWTFGTPGRVTYDLRIHHVKTPAEFDLMRVGETHPYGRGLIRREGETIRVIYRWDGLRPASFDDSKGIVLTLVRVSAR